MVKERFKLVTAVHLLLVKEGKILLLRRFNTGWADGQYSVPAGHLDGGETMMQAMIREAREECGVLVTPAQLSMVHVMHRKTDEERLDFFFTATEWQGEPKIMESNKCDEMNWYQLEALPENMVPYVRAGIECFRRGTVFSEFGWG